MRQRRFLGILLLALVVAGVGAYLVWMRQLSREEHYYATYSPIEEGLYLGGSVEKPPPGTSAVLNLCEQADPYQCETHRWEAIPDGGPAPSIDWLRQIVEFVDAQRKAGKTTYVHCYAGVNRAATVVTAYLMWRNHWTREEALTFVRSRRPEVRPHPAYMQLLLDWEEAIHVKQ
jgi:hypothetical protein